MILIADSGSTKTEWCLLEKGQAPLHILTKGINPFFQSPEEITQEITEKLIPQIPVSQIKSIFFYGAGCIPEKAVLVKQAIQSLFTTTPVIEVNSDMLGAARGLCGTQPGIACILGTGSNSSFYNGETIIANVSPLGFILGDEGSGSYLGKHLMGDLLKNQMPAALKEKFFQQYPISPAEIIDRVYRKPFPNRFLAGFTPFLSENLHEPCIHNLVLNGFKSFIERNVMQYDYTHYEVHFIGSIAYYFQDILKEAASQTSIRLGHILQSPMNGLIQYHSAMK